MRKTFKSATSDRNLIVTPIPGIVVEQVDLEYCGFHFNPSDGSALALAILEAAGHDAGGDVASADYAYFEAINWLQTCITRREKEAATAIAQAKETEALASRNKRRDELAREFDDSCDASFAIYDDAPTTTRRAIDRIIELEAEAAK